jgi:hypothetical protein
MTRDLFENDSRAHARADALRSLRAVCCRITGKVAAAATGLSDTHISKALSDDPGDRYLHDRHVDAILALATPDEVAAYWNARLGAYGLKVSPVRPRNADERLAALEERITRKFGEAGAELIDDERSRP